MVGKKLLGGAIIAVALLAGASSLRAAPPTTLSSDVGVCDPWFPQNCFAPLGRLRAGGDQYGLNIASATAPTMPSGTLGILVIPRGSNNTAGECLLWRDDATDPTGLVGNPVAAGQPFWYFVKTSSSNSTPNGDFKVIQADSATCTVNFLYFK